MKSVATRAQEAREYHLLVPGVALAAAGVAVAYVINSQISAVSMMLAAIILGILVRNLMPLPAAVEPGLAFAGKTLLRAGIVLLGLKLSFSDILGLGPKMIITVIAVVVLGITVGMTAGKFLGLPWRRRLLISAGFSICGAAAVAAVAGVVEESKPTHHGPHSSDVQVSENKGDGTAEDAAVAVALVVLFGTLMIPLVPLVGNLLGLSAVTTGMWAGSSVHEVAQVVAIGGTLGPEALGNAVIVKLGRVLMLAPVLIWVGWSWRRRIKAQAALTPEQGGQEENLSLPPIMPAFVAGFLVMVVVRTTGVVPAGVIHDVGVVEQLLLGAAMFALGTGVRASMFRRVGAAPFALAAILTVFVGCLGLGAVCWAVA